MSKHIVKVKKKQKKNKDQNYVFGTAQSLQNSLDMALGSEPIGNSNWLEGSITFVKVLVLRKSYARNNERKKKPLLLGWDEASHVICLKFKFVGNGEDISSIFNDYRS